MSKQNGSRYCGSACGNKVRNHLRRARIEAKPFENFSPAEIFHRDGWTCHLCNEAIDPDAVGWQAPSLDHLIPVSRPDFPGHLRTNVAASHWGCNHSKRHRHTQHDVNVYRWLTIRTRVPVVRQRLADDFGDLVSVLTKVRTSRDRSALNNAMAALGASIASLDTVDPNPNSPAAPQPTE